MPVHYPYLLNPAAYPFYQYRAFAAPDWATFDNLPQFTTLRAFPERDGRLVNWREEIEMYVERFKLGRVLWPVIQTLYAENFPELVAEVKRRGLYLFDFWGYVPGSPMEGMWSQITPPPGMVAYLESRLGDHFLGIDVGEQDGRYIGGYATQQCPSPDDRGAQYLNFHRHFQRMGDDLGNHLTALVSLCFGHYLLKEGNCALLGAETAQALPNSQLYYAFIRGAGKQYGAHWFGNASVWNRWGYKTYQSEGQSDGCVFGPEHGTSLSLLKRLLYTHYLYNCVAIGFESGWIVSENIEQRIAGATLRSGGRGRSPDRPAGGDAAPPLLRSTGQPAPTEPDRCARRLSPIGQIQAQAVEFVQAHGQPGVMHTPVALLLDFFAGWTPPRHLYTRAAYQVWGGMPYDEGDYLTHGVLSLLYPGYEDAGFYHDERGFLSPTPYGDIADCLLSDAPEWLLRRYGLVIAAGRLTMSRELADKLRAYVAAGGHLVLTAENAGRHRRARGVVPGLELAAQAERMPAGAVVHWADGAADTEDYAFDLYQAVLPDGAVVEATCEGRPAAVSVANGNGRYTVLLTPFGLNVEPLVSGGIENQPDASLARPYALLAHVRRALDAALSAQQLFAVSEGLGLVTCRKTAGDYLLAVFNSALSGKPLRIESRCGPLSSLEELSLDQSEKGQPGYCPTGFAALRQAQDRPCPASVGRPERSRGAANDGGANDDRTIAGGDLRLFAARVDERGVTCVPRSSPPPRPRNRLLALTPCRSRSCCVRLSSTISRGRR